MKYLASFFLVGWMFLQAATAYLDNHACSECHEKIYEEFQHSAHARSLFSDELHRRIAHAADAKHYECAPCHMPMADNLADLVSGKAQPDVHNKTHRDGVSCYFCHTIAYVKKAHRFNINVPARQAEDYKPTLYGRLVHPDDNDKHASVNNPIYGKMVCMGCHAHKINENNVTIFQAMDATQDSRECIRCHMAEVSGGAEKMDKRARGHHARHDFPGIRDPKFRATGYEINLTKEPEGFQVALTNKMGHPMIIQPARAKYLQIEVARQGKPIWHNYRHDPSEDADAYFVYRFFKDGKPIALPAHATASTVNNLAAHQTKILHYRVPDLHKGDTVTVTLYGRLAKAGCRRVAPLKDRHFTLPLQIKRVQWTVP
jgi:hypothetical protein